MLLRCMWIFSILKMTSFFWWNLSNAQDLGHAVLLLLLLVTICKWREELLKIKWAHKFEVSLCVKTSHLRTGYSRSTTGLPLIGQTTFSTEYIESVKSTSFSSSSSSSCFPDFRQQNCSCCNIEKRNCKYEMVMIICVFHKPQNCQLLNSSNHNQRKTLKRRNRKNEKITDDGKENPYLAPGLPLITIIITL